MLFLYMEKALERAEYKKLDDGSWFAEIPGFSGVWANAPTVEACRKELLEVLEGWLLIMKSLGSDLRKRRQSWRCVVGESPIQGRVSDPP